MAWRKTGSQELHWKSWGVTENSSKSSKNPHDFSKFCILKVCERKDHPQNLSHDILQISVVFATEVDQEMARGFVRAPQKSRRGTGPVLCRRVAAGQEVVVLAWKSMEIMAQSNWDKLGSDKSTLK